MLSGPNPIVTPAMSKNVFFSMIIMCSRGSDLPRILSAIEVAILGVSRAQIKPHFDGQAFVPRSMLPLSLSYDHRALNGADAARFTTLLAQLLGDIRELLLF